MAPALLFLAERFPPDLGGLARSAGRIAAAIARLGVAVDVPAWTRALPPGRLETEQSQEGPKVQRPGQIGSAQV